MELLDSCLGAFWTEIVAGKLGAHLELKAYGSLGPFRKEDPIASSCLLGLEVGYATCLQESRPHDWIVADVL